ncbi:MAG: DASS family sodium-coupled anion symporter [Micropepsaceae bacterium]
MIESKRDVKLIGTFIGLVFLLGVFVLPAPEGMEPAAWRVAGVALLMATWWMTNAIPIPATSLVPLVLFPLLGATDINEAAAPYASPIIFLFLGGFVLGIGMQRWSLHVRIGLRTLAFVGTQPAKLVGGFLLATALPSMWVSNTATTIMMIPVAVSVLALLDRRVDLDETSRRNLGIVLVLAVAYGATIGGLATIVGTPTTAVLVGFMDREYGVEIGFAQWMVMGVPLSAIMLLVCWRVLTWVYPVGTGGEAEAKNVIAGEIAKLGPLTIAEKRIALVFAITACTWIFRPLLDNYIEGLSDTGIAVGAALSLFFIPSGTEKNRRLLIWEDLRDLPWGVLLLFGGGLSLAAAISSSGLAEWVGAVMQTLDTWPVLLVVAVATIGMTFLTELTSNTASATAILPLAAAVAVGLGFDPLLIVVPLTLAASLAFMLPVATPPNAIAFSSGRITIAQMVRAGFWLNLFGIGVVLTLNYAITSWLFIR